MKITTTLALTAATTLVALSLAAAPATASGHGSDHSGETTELMATLGELNSSGGSGTAWVKVTGDEVWVKMDIAGLLDDAPHAQHIHIGGQNRCPDANLTGTGFNGAIRTTDAIDDYGPVAVSMTTAGGMVGMDHALDVANYPSQGTYTYERTFTVPEDVAHQIADGQGVIVIHGVDHDGSGEYDGAQESDLDPSLPSEATDPALCGELVHGQMAAPYGGVQTGGAGTAGVEYASLLAAGAALVLAGAGTMALQRRRVEN